MRAGTFVLLTKCADEEGNEIGNDNGEITQANALLEKFNTLTVGESKFFVIGVGMDEIELTYQGNEVLEGSTGEAK